MKTETAPGQYDPKIVGKPSSKSFSIGQRIESKPMTEPGPGSYKIDRDLKAACTKIGIETRESFFLKNQTLKNPVANKYGVPSLN